MLCSVYQYLFGSVGMGDRATWYITVEMLESLQA